MLPPNTEALQHNTSPKLSTTTSNPDVLRPFVPTGSDPWDYAHAAHLLRRAMVGPRHGEILTAVTLGLEATLDQLFTPFVPAEDLINDFADQDPIATPFGPEGTPEGKRYRDYILGSRERLCGWWLQTMVNSPVSLQERMTFFWHNHFVSDIQVVIFAEHMLVQNRLFRNHAWGSFRDLATAVTIDAAMLIYLDGNGNVRTAEANFINENYSRELLEIFTMGVYDREGRANYSQRDVSEGARALTGWQIPRPDGDDVRYSRWSRFDRDRHDHGVKEYLGVSGNLGAFDVLDTIFTRRPRQVAQFISAKLYRAFVSEKIDDNVVDAMADLLQQNDWNVEVPLKALFRSEHFYSERTRGVLVKPTHDLWMGLIRTLNVQSVPNFTMTPEEPLAAQHSLYDRLRGVGHLPFFPPNVKGWPGGHAWLTTSTAPPRLKFLSDIAMGRMYSPTDVPLYTFDPVEFARQFDQPNLRLLVRAIAAALLSSPITEREEQYLLNTALQGGGISEWSLDNPDQKPAERIRLLIDAIVRLPRFQLY